MFDKYKLKKQSRHFQQIFIRVGISSHWLGMWEFLDIDLPIAIKNLMHSNPFQF